MSVSPSSFLTPESRAWILTSRNGFCCGQRHSVWDSQDCRGSRTHTDKSCNCLDLFMDYPKALQSSLDLTFPSSTHTLSPTLHELFSELKIESTVFTFDHHSPFLSFTCISLAWASRYAVLLHFGRKCVFHFSHLHRLWPVSPSMPVFLLHTSSESWWFPVPWVTTSVVMWQSSILCRWEVM